MLKSFASLFALCVAAAPSFAADTAELQNPEQRLGYAIGYSQGRDFKQRGIELDVEAFVRGMKSGLSGNKSAMSDAEMQAAIQTLNDRLIKRQSAETDAAHLAGEAFLAENKKKSDVITLPSGLQYRIIKQGEGKSPSIEDSVVAHYRGTLVNGKEFDSSYARKEPSTFPLRSVIKAWQEALPLLKEGGKMQIFVPSNLGYGTRGAGSLIGPDATLIFDIELIAVKQVGKPAN